MKSYRRSPLDNSQSPPGRWGSLRRSRNSPSNSPSIAAQRDLNTFLEMASRDRKVAQQRVWGEARTAFSLASHESTRRSPELSTQTLAQCPSVTTCSLPQNQQPQVGQMSSQTPSSPPKTSLSLKNTNSHKTTTSYLSYDSTHVPVDTMNKVTVKPTSDSNQQFDYNNNGNNELNLAFTALSDHRRPSDLRGKPARMNKADVDFEQRASATGTMSVVLETCTLVPELKVFSKVAQTSFNKVHHASHHHRCNQDDITITDLEEEGLDKSSVQKSDTSSSLSQKEEDEGRAEKVVVWCVTGVCEAAGELAQTGDTHAQTETDQGRIDNQGGNHQASSVVANNKSDPEPANKKQVPVPISSQPVPVSRCDNMSLQASSPGWCPTKTESADDVPAFTTVASDKCKEEEKQVEGEEGSTNESDNAETLLGPTNRHSQNNAATSQKGNSVSTPSMNKKVSTSSKASSKNLRTTKTQPTAMKPTTSNVSTPNNSKPIRTLTSSESQGMRRVVPISRAGRSFSSLGKHPETAKTLNGNSLRQKERPSTAPSSRRSSIHKVPDSKDAKDHKVLGSTRAATREQNLDLQRRPYAQKASAKPRPQPEEKICRSTLRALTLAGERGSGSISAPATPLHKGTTHPSLPLPGFARNTASSSFRQTHNMLIPDSPKSSPKKSTSSSVLPSGTSPPFIQTGSLKVSTTSRSLDVLNTSPSLNRSQTIRVGSNSPLHNSVAPPKGHRRNDSGSFSDKSTHSRDSGKTTRPSWR